MMCEQRNVSPWVRIFSGICVWVGAMFLPETAIGLGSVFDAVQPGKSTIADLHARFGEPVCSEASGNMRIEHFNDQEKLFNEVSAWLDAQNVLQWARVKPLHTVIADDAPLLFGLTKEPTKTKGNAFAEKPTIAGETRHFRDAGVHFYVCDGIVEEIWLTQSESDLAQILEQLKLPKQEWFDQKRKKFHQQNKEDLKQDQFRIDKDEGKTPYLGVAFVRHSGEGIKIRGTLDNTPAQNSGLREGDIILEVENVSFRDKGFEPNLFSEMIKDLPVEKPLRFHIEREGKRFDIWIKLMMISKDQREAYQMEIDKKFMSDYSKGRRLMLKNNFAGAVDYFKKSLKSRPMESYQGLGICYYHLGEYKEARKCFEKTLKLDRNQPLSWFYGAANLDALNKRNGAIHGYKKYLKLNHDNAEMNAFARKRLDELKKGKKRGDFRETLIRIIDAIHKEVKK